MKALIGKLNFKLICCWLLLLQMVNLSINPVRHQNFIDGQYTLLEDLKINKIESIYELILEHVFKKDVPETQDSAEQGLIKVAVFFHQTPLFECQLPSRACIVVHNHAYQAYFPEYPTVLESPPPRA